MLGYLTKVYYESCWKTTKRKGGNKTAILAQQEKLQPKRGWHSLTIRKIAEEIEYTPPIVYEHFEKKEDLIREIVDAGFNMLSKEFAAARGIWNRF